MSVLREVTEHVADIKHARRVLDVDPDNHPVEFYLALLHIESRGREDLTDDDSYIGPLQIGNPYLDDAEEEAEKNFNWIADEIPEDHEGVRSDAALSIMAAMLYMEKYAARHEWDLLRMSAIHKGGAGSASSIRRRMRKGDTRREAIRWTALNYRYSSKHRRAGQLIVGPKLYVYVYGVHPETGDRSYRFVQALKDYSEWYEEQCGDTPAPIHPEREPEQNPTGEQIADLLAAAPGLLKRLSKLLGALA